MLRVASKRDVRGHMLPYYSASDTGLLFTPATISNLAVWLKADTLTDTGFTDGQIIASWPDSSGNVRNATQTVNTAYQPIYKANILKGFPVVRFDGSNDYLTLGNLSSVFPSAATLFVVATVNSDTQYSIYNAGSSDSYWRFASDGKGYFGTFRSSRLDQYPISTPSSGTHTWAIKSSSSSYEAIIDGVSKGSQTAAYSAGTTHTIGDNQMFNGDIAEIIVYSSALSSTEIDSVLSYLNAKWI